MTELEAMEAALRAAPVRPLKATLVRCVALLPLTAGGTPDYLFTSGQANRYNPAGVPCLFLGGRGDSPPRIRAAFRNHSGRTAALGHLLC